MKQFLIVFVCSILCVQSLGAAPLPSQPQGDSEQRSIVFRRLQRLRSNDGREIYLYSNRKCEMYDEDCLIVTTTYRLANGEVYLLDENGNTVYKGSYQMSNDRVNLKSVKIANTVYFSR